MNTTYTKLPADFFPILATSRLASTPFSWLAAEDIPPPYHHLLSHDRDMTTALQTYHGDSTTLEVHHSRQDGHHYLREVTLHAARSGAPVEYGVIEIYLDALPSELHPRILAGGTPLGALLNELMVSYHSEPQGFFHVPATALQTVFPEVQDDEVLYGRYNHLVGSGGALIARILEILPTAKPHH